MIEQIYYIPSCRSFSIESGGYQGKKRTPMDGGKTKWGLVGAAIGGIVGAFSGSASKTLGTAAAGGLLGAGLKWLINCSDKADFNKAKAPASALMLAKKFDEILTTYEQNVTVLHNPDGTVSTGTTTTKHRPSSAEVSIIYAIDGDPKDYEVSIAYDGIHMIFLIPNATPRILRFMNSELNYLCYQFKNADYKSTKYQKGYIVDLTMIQDSFWYIPYDLYKRGIKFNLISNLSKYKL